jgi:hypothetical protein
MIGQFRVIAVLIILCLQSVRPLGVVRSISIPAIMVTTDQLLRHPPAPALSGDWTGAKAALRNSDCCVVSVPGLEHHLCVLQAYFADKGPADLDLRARVRVKSSARDDCLSIRRSVSPIEENDNDDDDGNDETAMLDDPCTDALLELARGVASLADGPLEEVCEDVFIRIVCASNYKAIDPPYHTDKASLRGYVTLRGIGTEFVTRTCSPMEYAMLRGLGKGASDQSVRQAPELEFIIMKGDLYAYEDPNTIHSMTPAASFMNKMWKRKSACVHRSPPAATTGGRRRVIISLDLADGDDDREWYQANAKREWRIGMTQRKSRANKQEDANKQQIKQAKLTN